MKKLDFKFNKICEIKFSNITWYLKYEGDLNIDNINILLQDNTLKYLSINGHIYKFDFMIDVIDNINISYNPYSFRQNDISIKNKIYDILKTEIKYNNLYLIGGEMVFYNILLKPHKYIMYTDFQSIYEDACRNFNSNDIYLINYDTDILKKTDYNYSLIANTSKHGLGDNLCKEINKLYLDEIIIISCNKKSFLRDFNILKIKYNLIKMFDINTNYNVSVYFLSKI